MFKIGVKQLKRDSIIYIVAAFMIAVVVVTLVYFVYGSNINSKDKYDKDVLGVSDITSGDEKSGDSMIETSGDVSGEMLSGDDVIDNSVYKEAKVFYGDSRSVAVMIDNERGAWPQSGLNSAYMIYEIIIEGGATRFEALFKKDNLPDKLGPVRSSRHYFLDYAMEHDAIYVHFGWSPLAQSNIKSLGIQNINGIYDSFFWREPPKSSYHNAFTSKENLDNYIARKNYRDEQTQDCIIQYWNRDTDLTDGTPATQITIKYSGLHNTSYEYDPETKTYLRSMRGVEHVDRFTEERFYAKNILIYTVRDELLPDTEDKGRRELYNIGSGDGYYITNGKCIPMKWEKSTRAGRTVYRDVNGNELKFNDGITWVQIVPEYGSITISE